MDGFDANASFVDGCSQTPKAGRRRRFRIDGPRFLAIATAIAVLFAGLNGLVQILKVAVEVAGSR